MSKSPVISCGVILLSLALGACSSSSDGLMVQANLASANDDMCRSTGVPTGVAMLNGSQGAYAQCMQQRFGSGVGYDEEGHFAPGSQSTSLFNAGR